MQVACDLIASNTVKIPLRVEKYRRIDVGGLAAKAYCTDIEGTQVSFTAFTNSDWAEYEFTEGTWYEFENVNAEAYEHEIGLKPNWGNETITELPEAPSMRSHPGIGDDISLIQLGTSRGYVAFDIEICWTIPPAERDMKDLNVDDYEIAAIGVGAKPEGAEKPEVDSFLRTGSTVEDELACIERAIDWLAEYDASTILTYNGGHFDYRRLLERAAATVEATGVDSARLDRIRNVMASYYHADLANASDRDFGWARLEQVAEKVGHPAPPTYWDNYEHGLDPLEWRKAWDELPTGMEKINTRKVFGKDFPEFVERYFDRRDKEGDTDRVVALKNCLVAYSEADIEPLFEIAEDDRVTDYGAPRVSLLV